MLVEHMGARRLSSDIADRFNQVLSKDASDEELKSYENMLKVTSNLPHLWDDIVDSVAKNVADNIKLVPNLRERIQDKPNLQAMIVQALRLK